MQRRLHPLSHRDKEKVRTSSKGELAYGGMVIGANLISPINTTVATITTPTYSTAVASLAALLTLIFVVIIMLMAIKSMEV